ncbi:zinc metalloprotease [Pseudonocardiaceae bacterium YIM PH 21723]|nr:zinc metalloprotease [Pseudonocardiaceae bacterium YIM PH 21723]
MRLPALIAMPMLLATLFVVPSTTATSSTIPAAECLAGSGRAAEQHDHHDHADFSPAQVAADQADMERRLTGRAARLAATSIKVYVHVVSKDTTAAGGNVPDSKIADQIKVMNQTYGGTPFSFVLAGTDRTVNAAWHNSGYGTAEDRAMHQALHKGTAKDLNFYLATAGSNLGYATFPSQYSGNPVGDGIVVDFQSVPGGSNPKANLGYTGTHEAGHWLGLYHTFEGGCSTTGDQVADTPAELTPAKGCPEGQDSCSAPGADPIHNYMDYGDDPCMNQFTAGQSTRMQQQFAAYRA